MFTELELQVLKCGFWVLSSSSGIPFMWNGQMMILRNKKFSKCYNIATWSLLIIVLSCQLMALPVQDLRNDINRLVLYSLFLIKSTGHFALKLNMNILGSDFASFINEINYITVTWGKSIYFGLDIIR